jgi:hypothetical protein
MATKGAAIRKVEKLEERRLKSAARARAAAKAAWDSQKHTIVAGGSAFAIGFAENRGMSLPTVDAVDPTVLYAGAAFGASMFIKDKQFKSILEGITDGLLGVVAYKAAKNGFNSLFSYTPPAPTPEATPAATAGYGEEIIASGEF